LATFAALFFGKNATVTKDVLVLVHSVAGLQMRSIVFVVALMGEQLNHNLANCHLRFTNDSALIIASAN
jgi:hypothetical protein